MSEQSGGAGWWLASDGKWYPPEQATTAAQPAVDPTTAQPAYGGPPPGPPPGAPPGGPAYAAPAAAAARGGPGKIIAIVVVLALLAGGGAYLLTKGDGSSGSLKDFCAKANALHNSIDFDVALSDPARVDGVINALDQVTKAAPNEIKNDMNTLNDGLKRARSNVKAGKAPDNGFSDADRSKLDTASSNVERFGKANCGPDFQVSSSSVDTSFSFDSSSFTDSLSSQFSGFDTDSLSSLCEGFRSQFGSDFVCDNS